MRTRRSLTALLLFLLFVLLLPTPRWWWWCISISLPHCVCSCFLPSFLSFSLALAISCLLFFSCFLPLACVVHRYLLLWGGNCLSSGDEGNAQASRESARGGQVCGRVVWLFFLGVGGVRWFRICDARAGKREYVSQLVRWDAFARARVFGVGWDIEEWVCVGRGCN